MINRFTIAALALVLMGCSGSRFDDGYDFGDITLSVTDLTGIYCSNAPEKARKAAAKAIKSQTGVYPSDGVCGAKELLEGAE